MFRQLALLILLSVPTMTYAQLDSQFTFSGQNAEVLKAEKKITVITPEAVQVPSTCSRQVPTGQIEVCHNETRYRQECSWIPASQRCWTENERVCRTVTRHREVCSGSGSREVCTERPSREVCTERPTREVCRTKPDGSQHCTTVGGGTHCTTVGGGQSCRTVPGDRVCRNESYQDTDCDNVPRNRCETVPGRNDCRDIPYSERVCGMEMQYRTETYACTETQIINRKTDKVLKNEINVQVLTNGLVEEFPVSISVKESSAEFKGFSIEAKLMKQPNVFVVLKKKDVKVASVTATEIILKSSLVLEVMEERMLPIAFPTAITSASIEAATEKLTVIFEGPISSQGSVDLAITHKAFLSSTKTIAELKAEYPGEKVELGQVENKAALNINLKGAVVRELKKKNMKLKFKLASKMNLQGEIMNDKKPSTEKSYEGTFVILK